jgi:hypothetical protein
MLFVVDIDAYFTYEYFAKASAFFDMAGSGQAVQHDLFVFSRV